MSIAIPSFFALPSVVGLTASKLVATDSQNRLASVALPQVSGSALISSDAGVLSWAKPWEGTLTSVPIGAATTPSISFAGDALTGLYNPVSGYVGITGHSGLITMIGGLGGGKQIKNDFETHIEWTPGAATEPSDVILWRQGPRTLGIKMDGTKLAPAPCGFRLSNYNDAPSGGVNQVFSNLYWANDVFYIATDGLGDGIGGGHPIQFAIDGAGIIQVNTANFLPNTSESLGLGRSDKRWLGVYSTLGSFSGPLTVAYPDWPTISVTANDNSAFPILAVRRSRGTPGAPTRMLTDYELGAFSFGGLDLGGAMRDRAYIMAYASENWGDSANLGNRISISTTAIGASQAVERLRIMEGINVGGTTDPGAGKIAVLGGGNSDNWNSAYGWGNHADAGYLKGSSSWQSPVIKFYLDETLPATPTIGDRYIIGMGLEGPLAEHETEIVEYTSSGWVFTAPVEGWQVWDNHSDVLRTFSVGAWDYSHGDYAYLWGNHAGAGYLRSLAGAALLDSPNDGSIEIPAIKVTTGAGLGKVLTSDADGAATWQSPGNSAPGALYERARPASPSVYDDEFEGTTLDSKWTNNSSCTTDLNGVSPGWLRGRTTSAGGGILLVQQFAPTGDFSVTVKASNSLTYDWSSIQLVFYDGTGYNAINAGVSGAGAHVLISSMTNGNWQWWVRESAIPSVPGTWYIHVERRGNYWYSYASTDGRSWSLAQANYYEKVLAVATVSINVVTDNIAYPKECGLDFFRVNDFWIGVDQ